MQHLAEIGEIKSRAEAINLNLKQLSRLAGMHSGTVYRSANGKGDNRSGTLRKLVAALEAAELQTFLSLVELPHIKQAIIDRLAAERSEAA